MGYPNPPALAVRNEELWTAGEAMRELNRLLDRLDEGDVGKLVLTQRNLLRGDRHGPALLRARDGRAAGVRRAA